MTVWFEMFIEPRGNGVVYDLVRFDDSTENGYWGEEIKQAADGIQTWEHVIEDIGIFEPRVIKIDSLNYRKEF